ncbi:hypothetical protein AAGG52_23885 [Bacillus licheniformis]
MGHLRFNKELPHKASGTINQLESAFSHVFENMVFFREELDRHSGKAAAALQKNERSHRVFQQGEQLSIIFADSVQCFAKAVEMTDESDQPVNISPEGRSERSYAFSAERVKSEISINARSLSQAAAKFESNLSTLDEVLNHFETMLRQMMFETKFPWSDVDHIWPEAKRQINAIISEVRKRLQELAKEADELIAELTRVDNLISQQLQRVK